MRIKGVTTQIKKAITAELSDTLELNDSTYLEISEKKGKLEIEVRSRKGKPTLVFEVEITPKFLYPY